MVGMVIVCNEDVVIAGIEHGEIVGRYMLGKARARGVLQRNVAVDMLLKIRRKRFVGEKDVVGILRLLC